MTKRLPFLIAILISYSALSQNFTADFIYGKMVKENDTLTGYFSFSHEITNNGQTVYFRDEMNPEKTRTFQSRRYDYFESDKLYMETFGVVPTITGNILMMIPRIMNGKLQLFEVHYDGGGIFNMGSTVSFFIKKGNLKLRIKNGKFKKQMHSLIEDDTVLMQKVDNDELKYEDLIDIVKTYNNIHPI
jgi:hypothetical protein